MSFIRWERFDTPCENGGTQWASIASIDGQQVGGYVPPSEWNGGTFRSWAFKPHNSTKWVISIDCSSEDECRAFIVAAFRPN
jgi:hypothetical protein